MALQSLNCTGCGSGDVREVKTDTYFCNHCETVFKYADPTKQTVEATPAFCECGLPVEIQCQLCKKAMCGQCMLRWDTSPEMTAPRTWRQVLPVEGLGYRYENQLVLSWHKLVKTLGDPRWFCADCLRGAVPRTVEAIDAGRYCTYLFCANPPNTQCRCCERRCCESCLSYLGGPHLWISPLVWTDYLRGSITRW